MTIRSVGSLIAERLADEAAIARAGGPFEPDPGESEHDEVRLATARPLLMFSDGSLVGFSGHSSRAEHEKERR